MLATKELASGILSVVEIKNYIATLQFSGKKFERKIQKTSKLGDWFRFEGTNWMLDYDFNIKLDTTGNPISAVVIAADSIKKGQYPFFVYGTLREGMSNHRHYFNSNTIAVIPAKTKGMLYHAGGRLPYMFEGEETVKGDLVYVRPKRYKKTLQEVDWLEGYREGRERNNYERRPITVISSDGKEVQAWAYFNIRNDEKVFMTRIVDGDYVRWFNEYRRGRRA